MKRLLLAAALLLPGCASFAHGLVSRENAVLASWDSVKDSAAEFGGVAFSFPIAPVHALGRFALVFAFAGLSGAAHGPADALELVGLGSCPLCSAPEHAPGLEVPASPPHTPPVP